MTYRNVRKSSKNCGQLFPKAVYIYLSFNQFNIKTECGICKCQVSNDPQNLFIHTKCVFNCKKHFLVGHKIPRISCFSPHEVPISTKICMFNHMFDTACFLLRQARPSLDTDQGYIVAMGTKGSGLLQNTNFRIHTCRLHLNFK